jgi:hypothetical protein
MTRADMAKTVEHTEIGEDAAANHHVLKQRSIDAGKRGGRRLR